MSILEKLLPLERDIFLWLNNFHTPFWDTFISVYTYKYSWIPLFLITVYVVIHKVEKKESILLIVCMLVLGTLCDQISSDVIKPLFSRLRPSHHPDFKALVNVVNEYRGGQFGFTSSHSTNCFGITVFTVLTFRYRWYTLVVSLWVGIMMYTRIYLGVHFVSDILGGMLLGGLLALLVYAIYCCCRRYLLQISSGKTIKSAVPLANIKILIWGVLLNALVVFLYSFFATFLVK